MHQHKLRKINTYKTYFNIRKFYIQFQLEKIKSISSMIDKTLLFYGCAIIQLRRNVSDTDFQTRGKVNKT